MKAVQSLRQPSLNCTRRDLMRFALVLGTVALAPAAGDAAAPPPKETGLSFEGLLKDHPGFQPRKLGPLTITEIPGFLTRQQLALSYAVYRDVFARLLAVESRLAAFVRDQSRAKEYAALRTQQVMAANSVLLHEFYFRGLAPRPVKPPRYVIADMTEHIGSLDSWREDFALCANVAKAWVVLVYDPYDDRWHNVPLSDENAGGWIGSNPLVVCNVADSAWSPDYGNRAAFVTRFFEYIDWNVVASRYRAVDRQ